MCGGPANLVPQQHVAQPCKRCVHMLGCQLVCKEILLLPTSLILGKCSSLHEGPGYKDSQFRLMTNTAKVPWYFLSYQVLLLEKKRGQDLNAKIKTIRAKQLLA